MNKAKLILLIIMPCVILAILAGYFIHQSLVNNNETLVNNEIEKFNETATQKINNMITPFKGKAQANISFSNVDMINFEKGQSFDDIATTCKTNVKMIFPEESISKLDSIYDEFKTFDLTYNEKLDGYIDNITMCFVKDINDFNFDDEVTPLNPKISHIVDIPGYVATRYYVHYDYTNYIKVNENFDICSINQNGMPLDVSKLFMEVTVPQEVIDIMPIEQKSNFITAMRDSTGWIIDHPENITDDYIKIRTNKEFHAYGIDTGGGGFWYYDPGTGPWYDKKEMSNYREYPYTYYKGYTGVESFIILKNNAFTN